MAKNSPKRGLDEQELEGGGGGGGMRSTSVKDTKWSSMPSFKSNASLVDDIKKLAKDTSHLKGGAKKATELAQDRAATRTAIRAAGAGAAAAGAKAATSNESKKGSAAASDDYEDMSGDVNLDSSNPTGVAGKGMKKGGMTASRRADGIASRGKTKGRIV
jgi:hypothetical protein